MRASEPAPHDALLAGQRHLTGAGLLSNGQYRVALDARGQGCSAAGPHLLTAWAADPCGDPGGLLVHLRDRSSGTWWTLGAGNAVATDGAPRFRAEPGLLHLAHRHDGIEASMELWVDPDRPCELRRITVHNPGSQPRALELTTFVDVVLHDPTAHASHPTFSNLFLQTEWGGPDHAGVLLVRRRPRGADEHFPTVVHALLGAEVQEFETDRARFLGRGYRSRTPRALVTHAPLSGTIGNVLDPALCLRAHLDLAPGATGSVVLVLGCVADRASALAMIDELASPGALPSSRHGAVEAEHARRDALGLDEATAMRLQEVFYAMLGADPALRALDAVSERALGSVQDLQRVGIATPQWTSLIDAGPDPDPQVLTTALRAQSYARALGLPFESALIVAERSADLDASVSGVEGLHVFVAGELTAADRDRLEALAAAVWRGGAPPVPSMIEAAPPVALAMDAPVASPDEAADELAPLLLANEHGGFSADGASYVIRMRRREDGSWSRPPRPWVNVIANESFGVIVSESGATSTWSRNSREHRLTPWMNDPVLDPHAEALYLRDAASGRAWSPLPGPAPAGDLYVMEHGFGFSRCRHTSEGLQQEATIFVPRDAGVRIVVLRVRNLEDRPRRLGLFDHHRLVLGSQTTTGGRNVHTAIDAARSLLVGRDRLAGEFADGIAFASFTCDLDELRWSATGDREEFLGRGGSMEAPLHLRADAPLSGRGGAGLDAGFTQQIDFTLAPRGEVRLGLLFGEVVGEDALAAVLERFATIDAIDDALQAVREFWRERVGVVHVSTPSPALDLMLNGWLAYQTVVCRLWARSAFYQSGGAYGFRDQLQDAVALVGTWPELARDQILRNAAHQFVEGDVLHWWHPPRSKGLRTRFADDLLWLPHLTAHYLRVTGDDGVLEVQAPFLRARALEQGEDEVFLTPEPSGESASVFEHCSRAIDRSLAVGAHGLPLFGTGDWNDGMNRVGREGRGESVWMGFFLHTILGEWIPLCERRGEQERAERYRTHREDLGRALESGGWDGQWYRRGYYDDGTPLGSAQCDECRIDALVQAWSVISGAAPLERARRAMNAVAEQLVSESEGIIRLLAPPFVDTPHDPGYIKGYVAGVRENGGQYTHAALWVVRAFAELGEHDRALRLLERISPVHHTRSAAQIDRYQVEPYVVAADVYGVPPHVGRGGWTWYTGSAGWMMRIGLETVLGLSVEQGRWLLVDPRIPDGWPGFHIRHRPFGLATTYEIEVVNPEGAAAEVVAVRLDGKTQRPVDGRARIELARDGRTHRLEVVLGRGETRSPMARAAEVQS